MLLVVNKETQEKLKNFFKEIENEDKIAYELKWKEGTRLSEFMKANNINNEQLKCVTDKTASVMLYGENMLIESASTNALLYLTFTEFKDSLDY